MLPGRSGSGVMNASVELDSKGVGVEVAGGRVIVEHPSPSTRARVAASASDQ